MDDLLYITIHSSGFIWFGCGHDHVKVKVTPITSLLYSCTYHRRYLFLILCRVVVVSTIRYDKSNINSAALVSSIILDLQKFY